MVTFEFELPRDYSLHYNMEYLMSILQALEPLHTPFTLPKKKGRLIVELGDMCELADDVKYRATGRSRLGYVIFFFTRFRSGSGLICSIWYGKR